MKIVKSLIHLKAKRLEQMTSLHACKNIFKLAFNYFATTITKRVMWSVYQTREMKSYNAWRITLELKLDPYERNGRSVYSAHCTN